MAALRGIALTLAQGPVHLGEGWGVRVDCFQSSDWSVDPHFIGKLTTRSPLLLGAMHHRLQDQTGRGNQVVEAETVVATARVAERGARNQNLIQRRKVSFLLTLNPGLLSSLLKQFCCLLLWVLFLIAHWKLSLLVVALNTTFIIGVLSLLMTGSSML